MILCHRGDTTNYTENTIKSLSSILKIENDNVLIGIEFDIQLTKDDMLICYHDKDMKRLYKDDRIIEDTNSYDIKNDNICYLEDIINLFKNNKKYILNIELKIYNLDNERKYLLCKKIIDVIKYSNCPIIITSFNNIIINILNKFKSNFKIGYITDDINFDMNILNNIDYLICNKNIDSEFINKISKKIKILIFTIFNNNDNDLYLIDKYKSNSNIGFITDNIYLMLNS